MDRSRSLLVDDVGDRSNDGRRGVKPSIGGSSSCESFRQSGQEYVNGDSRMHWPPLGEEGWNAMEGEDRAGEWGRDERASCWSRRATSSKGEPSANG
jgi:hypothetical protein